MTAKEFIVNDLKAEKENYISMIRNNQMTDEERAVLNSKIDALDARIESANKLDEDNKEDAFKSLNAKFEAIKEKLSDRGIKVADKSEGYLDSKNALHDFADAMRSAKTNHTSFTTEWNKYLSTNGVGPVGGMGGDWTQFAPTPVKGYIEDAWNEYGDILKEFRLTGAKSYMVRANLIDQDGVGYAGGVDDIWANGWDSKVNATSPTNKTKKKEQTLTLDSFIIDSEFVYKLVPLSNKTIWDDDANLIQYVLDELLKQWNYTVLRAILIGDGRTGDTAITSIAPIVSHNDAYATQAPTQAANEGVMEYFVEKLIEPIHNGDDDILLFVSKADFTALRKYLPAAGATPTYMSAEDVAKMMGVKRIVTVPYLKANPATGEYRAIAVHAKKYFVTGSLTPEFLSWEEPMTNERYFRVEIPVGGNLGGLMAATYSVGE